MGRYSRARTQEHHKNYSNLNYQQLDKMIVSVLISSKIILIIITYIEKGQKNKN